MDADEVQAVIVDIAGTLAPAHQATLLQPSEGEDEGSASLKVPPVALSITLLMQASD